MDQKNELKSRDFRAHRCELPAKSIIQVGRFYHTNKVEVPHRRDQRNNRQVSRHQSVAKIACDFRWQSNSPRSAYKIARCVASLSKKEILRTKEWKTDTKRLRLLCTTTIPIFIIQSPNSLSFSRRPIRQTK